MELEHNLSASKTRVEKEVDSRRFQDLEEKRAMLTQKVYGVLHRNLLGQKDSQAHDQKIYDKYERIVYADTETIENIFHATDDFYEAILLTVSERSRY